MYQQLVRNQSQAGSKYFETGQSLGLASHNFSTEANPLKDFQQSNSKITLALRWVNCMPWRSNSEAQHCPAQNSSVHSGCSFLTRLGKPWVMRRCLSKKMPLPWLPVRASKSRSDSSSNSMQQRWHTSWWLIMLIFLWCLGQKIGWDTQQFHFNVQHYVTMHALQGQLGANLVRVYLKYLCEINDAGKIHATKFAKQWNSRAVKDKDGITKGHGETHNSHDCSPTWRPQVKVLQPYHAFFLVGIPHPL